MTQIDRKRLTVKNVKNYIRGHDRHHVVTMQQTLEWFGESRKLERILWSLLKKHEITQKYIAENKHKFKDIKPPDKPDTDRKDSTHNGLDKLSDEAIAKAKREAADRHELQPLTQVVHFCPKCGDPVYGVPQRSCKKRKHEPVFYKECKTCSWWAEVWRHGNKFEEVEGG